MPRSNSIGIWLGVLMICMHVSFCSFSQVPQDTSVKKLLAEIEKFSKDPSLLNARWGICVITADSGKTIAAYNDSTGLIPASTMKAINTAATLSMMGKDYTFKTYLFYDGDVDKDSVLHGNIYIKGGGDPTLGSPRIDTMNSMKYLLPLWITNIRKQGIKKVQGSIVGDASIFDDTIAPPSWIYGDLGNYYGAGASGLTFHENAFRIILKSGIKYYDSARIVEIDPPVPYLTIKNNMRTGGFYSANETWVFGNPYENVRTVKGIIRRGEKKLSVRASLPDPAFFCAYSLYKALRDSGIVVTDPVTTSKALKEQGKTNKLTNTVFYTQQSPSLDTIIYYTNQSSINTYAEDIIKILAYEKTGTGCTYNGTKLVTQFWASKGVNLNGFVMKDGSGLSVENRVSPRQLAEIMSAYITDTMFPFFYRTLPSVKVPVKDTIIKERIKVKSGYMIGIRAYTGYVYNKKNKLLTFGIIVNNHSATISKMNAMLEKIMIMISETEW